MGRVESGVDEMKLFKMLFVCFASFDSYDNPMKQVAQDLLSSYHIRGN